MPVKLRLQTRPVVKNYGILKFIFNCLNLLMAHFNTKWKKKIIWNTNLHQTVIVSMWLILLIVVFVKFIIILISDNSLFGNTVHST